MTTSVELWYGLAISQQINKPKKQRPMFPTNQQANYHWTQLEFSWVSRHERILLPLMWKRPAFDQLKNTKKY